MNHLAASRARAFKMAGYIYIWEYDVRHEKRSEFERTYGPGGEWVRLFRRAPGYIRSELHRDRLRPQRFITIDYWESASAWQAFRTAFSQDFESLDERCAGLTLRETELGSFEPAGLDSI